MAAFGRAAAQGGLRGGGREARAALEAERSNDESAGEETFPRSSAAARSAFCTAARGLAAAARRGICGQDVCGGYQASRRFARSNRGGAVKLRSASEKRPVNAMPPSACVSRRKPAFGAAAHRSQKIGGAKALLLIGCAEPEREERRGDTQTGAGTPFPERRDTAGGQTHPTAVHRKRLREGTAMRECGNPLHPLEHANPGQGHLLQALALAAERYAERRSRNAGKAFREAADTAARPRRAAVRTSQEPDCCGACPEFVSVAPRRAGSVPIEDCAAAGIGKPAAVPTHLSEAAI